MADRGDRRDVDDRAAALLLHHGDDVLHGEEGAFQVDREDAIPFRLRHLDHAAHLGDADIVVEHVDAAIGFQAGRDHRLDIGGARDIGGERRRLAALAGDDIDGFLRGLAVAVDAKHLRALARKGHRGRLAVAPARPDRTGADHHRCLALEPFHRLLSLFDSCYGVHARIPGSTRLGRRMRVATAIFHGSNNPEICCRKPLPRLPKTVINAAQSRARPARPGHVESVSGEAWPQTNQRRANHRPMTTSSPFPTRRCRRPRPSSRPTRARPTG